MKGLEGLLDFLSLLRSKRIEFSLEQKRNDSIMVTFPMVGYRVEVDFFVDRIEFSYFAGDESINCDETMLLKLIDKHGD